jgi:hypothetical protein
VARRIRRHLRETRIVTGGTAGYRNWIGFDKERRTAAVVLTNSSQGADDLGFELLTVSH